MQTFLPYRSFTQSAKVLDRQRLGKQRVEAWQIYKAITEGTGWKHHPIVKMWSGYESALLLYGICICKEWIGRGYKDTMLQRFKSEFIKQHDLKFPLWLNDEEFFISHQSNLLRKNMEHYSKYFNVPNDLPYKWFV